MINSDPVALETVLGETETRQRREEQHRKGGDEGNCQAVTVPVPEGPVGEQPVVIPGRELFRDQGRRVSVDFIQAA